MPDETLGEFYSRLAADSELLSQFLGDPQAVLSASTLSSEDQQALLSGDESQIRRRVADTGNFRFGPPFFNFASGPGLAAPAVVALRAMGDMGRQQLFARGFSQAFGRAFQQAFEQAFEQAVTEAFIDIAPPSRPLDPEDPTG